MSGGDFFFNWSVFSVIDTYLNPLAKWKLQSVNQRRSVGDLIQNILEHRNHTFSAYLDDLPEGSGCLLLWHFPHSDHSPLFVGADQGSPVPRVHSFLSPISAGTVPHIPVTPSWCRAHDISPSELLSVLPGREEKDYLQVWNALSIPELFGVIQHVPFSALRAKAGPEG